MKNKKILIGLVIMLFLLALLVGVSIYKSKIDSKPHQNIKESTESNKDENEIYEALGNLVQNVNDIMNVYLNGPTSDTDYYTSEASGEVCSKYIGEDKNVLINNILRTYEDPFFKGSNFEVKVVDNYVDEIYFCGVSTCETNNYSILDVQVLNLDDDTATVFFETIGVGLSKTKDGWKFQKPLPVCKPKFQEQ